MSNQEQLQGVLPNTTIQPEFAAEAPFLPTSYTLLRDNDEQITIHMQVGNPIRINGWCNEDLISILEHRITALNNNIHSSFNDVALSALKSAKDALTKRFDITGMAIHNLEYKSCEIEIRVKSRKRKGIAALFQGFLFIGLNTADLETKIRRGQITTTEDLKDVYSDIFFDGQEFIFAVKVSEGDVLLGSAEVHRGINTK